MAGEKVESPNSDVHEGRKLLRKKKFDEAAVCFERAIEANPLDTSAHEAMATLAFLKKDYQGAADCFRQAARCDARRAEPLVNLGAVLNKMKDYKGAIDALQKALSKNRSNPEAYYNLGIAYRGAGQSSMAVSAYKEAIRLKSDFAEAHQNLGNAYLDTKNTRQATAAFNRALEISPDLAGAKRGLQKANAVATNNKVSAFGRLAEPKFANGPMAPKVVLTEIQRAADREIVNAATVRLERALMAWTTELHHQMEPAIKSLVKAISNNELSDATTQATSKIGAGLSDADELSRLLHDARQLLTDHEQDILARCQAAS